MRSQRMGIPLVGHGRRAYLLFLEGFFHLLHVLKQPHIVGKFIGGLRDARQAERDLAVDLPAVGLSGNGIMTIKPHLPGNQFFQLFHLIGVIVEKRHEAGLGARCSLYPVEPESLDAHLKFLDVEYPILRPQAHPFAHGGRLGGLEVGETQGGLVFVGHRVG